MGEPVGDLLLAQRAAAGRPGEGVDAGNAGQGGRADRGTPAGRYDNTSTHAASVPRGLLRHG